MPMPGRCRSSLNEGHFSGFYAQEAKVNVVFASIEALFPGESETL